VVLENDGTLTVAWTSKEPGEKETALVDAKVPGGGRAVERGKAGKR
jgi:hypothetical protein